MTAGSIAVPMIIPLKLSKGPKYVIDSSTRIELASETADTVMFYTLDGTRPVPTQKHLRSPQVFMYKTPFTLTTGKVTIKAMACSLDRSKESSVVTKTFTVLEAADDSSDYSEDEMAPPPECESPSQPPSISVQLRHRLSMNSKSNLASGGVAVTGPDLSLSETSPANLQQFQHTVLTSSSRSLGHASIKSTGQSTAVSVGTNISRPATTEIPKPVCLYCKSPRLKDPCHKFCTHCGMSLPPLPSVDPEPPLQVAVCSNCRAHVPLGSTSCLVCEHSVLHPSPIPVIQAQANAEHMLKEKIVCLICGTRNPPFNMQCLTCEKPLPPQPVMPPLSPTHTPPPLPNPTLMRPISGSSYMMCGLCGRINVSDARFCDWCGSKPHSSQLSVQCAGCLTPNDWHCRHCFACGRIIKAPLRPKVELSSTMKMPVDVELDKNAWIPVVEIEDKGPEMKTLGTQTDGIFYPSARTIGNLKGSEFMKKMIHITARDRLPKLHTYSPGKGFWRMQVEHVCTHLRAHSQTSNLFQSSIGTPQLGKLLYAEVKDEEDPGKIDIHLIFASKQHGTNDDDSTIHRTTSYDSIPHCNSQILTQSAQTVSTELPPTPKRSKSRQHYHRRRSHSASMNRARRKNDLSGETKKLYKELSLNVQGRKEVVSNIISKGADVNACAPDTGLPMLSLAVSNNHVDCIAILVENGAKVNGLNKATGNTALHEAVLKGLSHIPCIEALLGHSADAKRRNANGLTPCDLAMKLKHDEIVTCFATYVGASLLDNLYKYQPSLTL